jgi:hypothetical protein
MLLLVVSGSAIAEWAILNQDQDGETFLDLDEIKTLPNGNKTAWIKQFYNQPQDSAPGIPKYIYIISLNQYKFDCTNNQYSPVQYVNYGENNVSVDSFTFSSGNWLTITPKTAGEHWLKSVCNENFAGSKYSSFEKLAGWGKAKFDMTVKQVATAYPKEAKPVPLEKPDSSATSGMPITTYNALEIRDYLIEGKPFHIIFEFGVKSHKLRTISISGNESSYRKRHSKEMWRDVNDNYNITCNNILLAACRTSHKTSQQGEVAGRI